MQRRVAKMIYGAVHFLKQSGDYPESTATVGTRHIVFLDAITTHSLKSYLVIGSSASESFTGVP